MICKPVFIASLIVRSFQQKAHVLNFSIIFAYLMMILSTMCLFKQALYTYFIFEYLIEIIHQIQILF